MGEQRSGADGNPLLPRWRDSHATPRKRERGEGSRVSPRFFLVIGNDAPIADPPWSQIEAAVRDMRPDRSVALVKADRTHVRADGRRAMYTIVWYETAQSPPLVIGRRAGGRRRGRATLADRRVLVSPLENWSTDGIEVFRAFHGDRPLADAFDLRDARTEYSDDEIRTFLLGDTRPGGGGSR